MKKKSFIIAGIFLGLSASSAFASSVTITHTSFDTVTVSGQFTGENCYNLGKTLSGGIELSSRGGTTDSKINLDLTQAKIFATLNGTPIKGTQKLNIPLPVVNDIFLISDPQLVLNKTDVIKLTVTGAKIKNPGEVGLTIGYGNPDPRGSVEMYCHWDSLGDGGQHLKVAYVYPSIKPSPSPSPSILALPLSSATISPTILPSPTTSPKSYFVTEVGKKLESDFHNWWVSVGEFFRKLFK